MGHYKSETTTVTTTSSTTTTVGIGAPDCTPEHEQPCPITDPDSDLLKVLRMLQIILRRIDRIALDQQRLERTVNRQGRKLGEVLRIVRNLENPPAPPHVPTRIVVRYGAPQQEN